jgi:DNA-binding CsgD family transcriptional regulator
MKTTEQIADETGLSVHTVRHFANAHGMKLAGGRYWFDEKAEALIKGRRTLEGDPHSARTIAKKNGCSVEKVAKWARNNGVVKRGAIFYFTPEEADRFAMEKDLPVVGRPKNPIADVSEKPKLPRGRPRKEKPPKVPERCRRPRKDGINGSL